MWLPLLAMLSFRGALASEAVDADWHDAPRLELQIPDDSQWNQTDLHATSVAKAGTILIGAGALSIGAGAALLATRDDLGEATGAMFLVAGVGSMAIGPPILLGASMRANTALRERGVFSTTVPTIAAWTLLGSWPLPALVLATSGAAAPIVYLSATYVAVVSLGLVQLEVNKRARTHARLASAPSTTRARTSVRWTLSPTPRGAMLGATF